MSLADQALEGGSVDKLVKVLTDAIVSFCPATAIFRNLGVNLRICLCGVTCYASAQILDFLDLAENCWFPNQKRTLHPSAVSGWVLVIGIRERFAKAYEHQQHADDRVLTGREFVQSYVVFTHYVEGLHGLIKGKAAHHGDAVAATQAEHAH